MTTILTMEKIILVTLLSLLSCQAIHTNFGTCNESDEGKFCPGDELGVCRSSGTGYSCYQRVYQAVSTFCPDDQITIRYVNHENIVHECKEYVSNPVEKDACLNKDNNVLLTSYKCSDEGTQCLKLDLQTEYDYDDNHVYMCAEKKAPKGSTTTATPTTTNPPKGDDKGPDNTTSYICFAFSGFSLIVSIGLFFYRKRL